MRFVLKHIASEIEKCRTYGCAVEMGDHNRSDLFRPDLSGDWVCATPLTDPPSHWTPLPLDHPSYRTSLPRTALRRTARCLKREDPQMCTFEVLGLHTTTREPKREHFRAPAFKKHHQEDPPREGRKNENCGKERKKKTKFWAVWRMRPGGRGSRERVLIIITFILLLPLQLLLLQK